MSLLSYLRLVLPGWDCLVGHLPALGAGVVGAEFGLLVGTAPERLLASFFSGSSQEDYMHFLKLLVSKDLRPSKKIFSLPKLRFDTEVIIIQTTIRPSLYRLHNVLSFFKPQTKHQL